MRFESFEMKVVIILQATGDVNPLLRGPRARKRTEYPVTSWFEGASGVGMMRTTRLSLEPF